MLCSRCLSPSPPLPSPLFSLCTTFFSAFTGLVPSRTGVGPCEERASSLTLYSLSPGYFLRFSSWSVGLDVINSHPPTSSELARGCSAVLYNRNQQVTLSPVDPVNHLSAVCSKPPFWVAADFCLLLFVVACFSQMLGALLRLPCVACANHDIPRTA